MNLFNCIPHPLHEKRKRLLNQTLPVMRLIIFLTVFCCFRVSATVYAQSISLTVKQASLENVFDQIKKQSGYTFWYKDNTLNNARKVTLDIHNASLEDALELCFKGQPLSYEIVDKTIVVKAKPVKAEVIPEKTQQDARG